MQQEFFNQEQSPEAEFPEKETHPLFRFLHAAVSLLVIAGLVYLSGVHQYFFFRKTPASVTEKPAESKINAETITVPLVVFILANNGALGSRRNEENARRLVSNAEKIWDQANIILSIKTISAIELPDGEIERFFNAPEQFLREAIPPAPSAIRVLLIGKLNGINGIAFTDSRSIAVADITTVYDFRTLAHEIGHVLGLQHAANDKNRLMYRGANGTEIAFQEIITAREHALSMFGDSISKH